MRTGTATCNITTVNSTERPLHIHQEIYIYYTDNQSVQWEVCSAGKISGLLSRQGKWSAVSGKKSQGVPLIFRL